MSDAIALPRAVLFDWDNTLVENWRTIQDALNAALADAGKPVFTMEETLISARHSGRDVFPRLFGNGWKRAREIFYAHFAAHHLAGLRIMPDAEAAMDVLAERGVPLGIVSNKLGAPLRREVAHLGWSERFFAVIGAQDAPADKPDPAPIHMMLKAANILPGADIWVIGDTDIDMRAAVAAGCSGVLVGPDLLDRALLIGAEPILEFHSCKALAGFVRGIEKPIFPTNPRVDGSTDPAP